MSAVTRAESCIVACVDLWAGDGEILASPFGLAPLIGARVARATSAPELLMTDGEGLLAVGVWALGEQPETIEGWLPFRATLDLLWGGRRHVVMMPSQIDRFGNANISFIGSDYRQPTVQLLGVRGAPGNSVNHATSYWLPRHSTRSFVPRVDMVCGVGNDSAAAAGPEAERYHDLRRVISNLGVFDFGGPGGTMRAVSLHPGVEWAEVEAATGFEIHRDGEVPETRAPSDEELRLIREVVDPRGLVNREVRP